MTNNIIDVVLVDEKDREIGREEKLKAHQQGKLHRAFSIFVFNSKNQLLLQKRARSKYHSGSLWSNTCCGHPLPEEDLKTAVKRRLKEEMGFNCGLKKIYSFVYKTKFPNQLIENEYNHVFWARYDGQPIINREEAEDWRWADVSFLKDDIEKNPENYTYWFRVSLSRVLDAVLARFRPGDNKSDNFSGAHPFQN